MNDVLCRQMAVDYCCTDEDVADGRNHFSEHRFLEGRRRFREEKECFLKIAVINGKVLAAGRSDIIAWFEDTYANAGGAWFFEAENLIRINERIRQEGYKIGQMHPFYISDTVSDADTDGYEVNWYRYEEIERFRGDNRYNEAFTFCTEAPDVIGVSAGRDGKIFGMAGASADSPAMWQIGINVDSENRRSGIGKMLVKLLKNEILRQGILPYYGTAVSHIASQKVALGAGFVPAWAELTTSLIR